MTAPEEVFPISKTPEKASASPRFATVKSRLIAEPAGGKSGGGRKKEIDRFGISAAEKQATNEN